MTDGFKLNWRTTYENDKQIQWSNDIATVYIEYNYACLTHASFISVEQLNALTHDVNLLASGMRVHPCKRHDIFSCIRRKIKHIY